jgi:hypothetical protein
MKKYMIALLLFFSPPLLWALVIEDTEFQGSLLDDDLVKVRNSINVNSIDTSDFILNVSRSTLHAADFSFLKFTVEDESILDTYFTLEDPEFAVQGAEVAGLVGKLKVAPTPVNPDQTSYYAFRLGSDQNVSIALYTRRGQLVETIDITSGTSPGGLAGYNKVPIENVSELPAGLYFAFIRVGSDIQRTKFEVQP